MQSRPTRLARRMLGVAIASTFASAAFSAAAAPTYTITQISASNCAPVSINDRSDIAGTCDSSAVIWHQGVVKKLGRLTGGTYADATYVNAFGVAVGDSDTGNSRPQGFVSSSSGLVNFFPNNGGNTRMLFVGDNGYMGGYYTKSLSGNTSSWKGAIWTVDPKDSRKYNETDLPVLPGGVDPKATSSLPTAFNQSGQAAGYASNDQIGQHAVLWKNDAKHTVVDLGVFPGDWTSVAWGINDAGQVVGESHPAGMDRPVMWDNDAAHTVSELPVLPGDNVGSASEINMLGQIIGWSAYRTPDTTNTTVGTYVLWQDGAVYDLQSLLEPLTGAGWVITGALGLNNLGQIVGVGKYNGAVASFVMTPVAQ